MNSQQIKSLDQTYVAHTYGRFDLALVQGSGATAADAEGNQYIDFGSGIGVNSLGYSDPQWAEAVAKQAALLNHTSNLYYTQPDVMLAQALCQRSGMKRVFFGNSGAEANEGAIKAARKYSFEKYGPDRYEIITLVNSFHGRTMATLTATGQESFHNYFFPFNEGFAYAAANDMEDVKAKTTPKTCAILLEMVQGEGGVIPLDRDFVRQVAEYCKEKDLLLLVDEVQTGIGRTGSFFAYQQFGIQPDIVSCAKGLGGGLPIGGVLFSEKTQDVLGGGDHGSTFGGNPVVCAGANVVMERLDDAFLDEVKSKGTYLKEKLEQMDNVESVTGLGLMIGVQLKKGDAKSAAGACIQKGLLVLTAKSKVRFLPPLTITYEEIDEGLKRFESAINSL